MQHSPTEIKDKLLKALDKEYNVVDMATVFEVVSVLERTPITKEALEATRLGKYINELRRKTSNESLAKRAKDLVRRWRNLISKPPESSIIQQSNHTNGSRTISPNIKPIPISPSLRSNPNLSPNLPFGSSLTSPALSSTYGSKNRSLLSPAISITSDKSTSPRLSSLNQSSAVRTTKSSAIRSKVDQPTINSGVHTVDSVPKTHAANKRLRKDSGSDSERPPAKTGRLNGMVCKSSISTIEVFGECSRDSFGPLSDKSESVVEIPPPVKVPEPETKLPKKRGRKKGSTKEAINAAKSKPKSDDIVINRIASIVRNPKVKTTQELLAGLQAKTSGSQDAPVSSEKPPSLPNSVVGSRGSALDALEISRNKTEHIARFLRSQSELESSEIDSHYSEDKPSFDSLKNVLVSNISNSKDFEAGSELRSVSRLEQSCVDDAFVSSTPSQSVANIVNTHPDQSVEEILSKLPPLEPDEIVWSSSESESEIERLKSERVVTSTDVDRLHSEHWSNVNGIHNDGTKVGEDDDGFREWHECVSKKSYQGDLLHILPYTVID